ncbi:MAG: hypothetical protein A2741_01015 [Candidatus Zambryskibacteria bacterium RIFCSPHIGHO2_01_FULL_43_27]|uniref:PrgI family protein n=1 Tax=Candidatus Zambryskibacteria bacterium RIFCSPLOWO2_01_FULL_43_17 TaxID=1802760 RepID=A0A1G2U6M7_9BACT|nr:MAG: hypothetical protein A2741_01015 [Candidatus Zambryskibacteria bacterium RIFCSPHIGHO2_01_FULL_43_27]OHB00082.1 MAG: hypothetical protein A3E93_02010 [Candidatus Zambryskibacteria bacterium RIFCSPHIGHO2_12_FULL_43_12b]OHB04612.1 MAG: hypothetical protein A2920_01595 [Candidatus Zambryskibacteria bacterium RIFCSPLOWO2_01_FULL_43_17]
MRFQVPQFIEVEDKLFGPFTLKQFLYLAGGAGIIVVLFSILPKFIAILISLPILIVSLALAFFKVNNRPFINALESFFKYTAGEKLYIWKKATEQGKMGARKVADPQVLVPRLSDSKLKDLSWSLDVKQAASTNNQLSADDAEVEKTTSDNSKQ